MIILHFNYPPAADDFVKLINSTQIDVHVVNVYNEETDLSVVVLSEFDNTDKKFLHKLADKSSGVHYTQEHNPERRARLAELQRNK